MPATIPSPSALDVAELILRRLGPVDGLKLQKLVYYVQAMSLASQGRPIFRESIQAWIHGPVVSELWQMHAGNQSAASVGGDVNRLSKPDVELIDEVLAYYGDKTGLELRQLTHDEEPWKAARGGLPDNQPSTAVITPESLRTYYQRRPWGGGSPVTDLSAVPVDMVKRARQEIADGLGVDPFAPGALARAV